VTERTEGIAGDVGDLSVFCYSLVTRYANALRAFRAFADGAEEEGDNKVRISTG